MRGLLRTLVALAFLHWGLGAALGKAVPAAVLFGVVYGIGVWALESYEPARSG
ncbi:hypothetical protein R5W24_000302 [Gemmata sp. JC717]|uniref:Uncharacterized protein n=1 Tax=Gemmata algarum TaxID=2975278 RepID=A0ABU5EYX2_9BACT|nr:hypothetical protein [Gemmata algarum]MDY3551227.1 hypothetical protein [Gemmata algarum]MDY3558881.1 hypothetical protein [Gemmata algarum]